MLFKLKASKHYQADLNWKASEEEIEAAKRAGTTPRAPTKEYTTGQLVPSRTDLVARHGTEKFQLVDASDNLDPKKRGNRPAPVLEESIEEEEALTDQVVVTAAPRHDPEQEDDGRAEPIQLSKKSHSELQRMTIPELKKFCEDEEIDLGNATTKQEILTRVKQALRL